MAEFDEVRIGDFSKPVGEMLSGGVSSSPVKEKLDAAEKQLDDKATVAEATLRPMQTYEDRLREVGVTREEAARIIDAVLLRGFYSEEIPITKSISLRLRTRTARDTKRIQEELAQTGRVIREKARQAGAAVSDATADARITGAIKTRLLKESNLAALKIDVDTHEGAVTLSGVVASAEHISRTMEIAYETEGVRKVISTLQVKGN